MTSAWIQSKAAEAGEQGFTELQAVLADGQVTKEEYWQGIVALRECVEGKGYGMTEPQLSPVTGITYEFVYLTNGRDQNVAFADLDECEARYVGTGFLDMAYREMSTQIMDPALRSAVLQCLSRAETPGVGDGRNLAEIAPLEDEDRTLRDAAVQCTKDEGQRLFPELPSMAVYG